MQVRKIKASKKKNYRGSTPSKKCGAMIQWESLLERDYIYLLEFDTNVKYFESQSVEIDYLYKGKKYCYYPDFRIFTTDNRIKIVEVKPRSFLQKEENLRKYQAGKMYCEERGWEFLVVTEDNIRKGFLQENLRKLFHISYDQINVALLEKLKETIKNEEPIKINSLVEKMEGLFDKSLLYKHIYYLIFKQQIYTDLINTILGETSILNINHARLR